MKVTKGLSEQADVAVDATVGSLATNASPVDDAPVNMPSIVDNVDERARLTVKDPSFSPAFEQIFGSSRLPKLNILAPLRLTKGILFPYRPAIQWGGSAEYQNYHSVHSNYKYNTFERSAPMPINIQSTFTSQTTGEARYTLAVMHFLQTATKMYFGEMAGEMAGVPPPTLSFYYMGKYMFNYVPVVVTNYSYTLDNNVDYVPVRIAGKPENDTYVPIQININIQLEIQMNTRTVRKEFDLDSFRDGSYLDGDGNFQGWL